MVRRFSGGCHDCSGCSSGTWLEVIVGVVFAVIAVFVLCRLRLTRYGIAVVIVVAVDFVKILRG